MRVLLLLLAVLAAAQVVASQQQQPGSMESLDQKLKELRQMVAEVTPRSNASKNATVAATTPSVVSHPAAPANATATAPPQPTVQQFGGGGNASAPAAGNNTNNTDYALAFGRHEDTNPATNATVRLFMDQIPTVPADNASDANDRALIHRVIHILHQLIKIDLNGRFTGGHGIYFRHRMWKHLLDQTERALQYLKRVLEAQMVSYHGSKARLSAALARMKECLHKIKLLKREGRALRIDLDTLNKRIAAFKDKDLSGRLRVELKESEKPMAQRQFEAKAAKQAVTAATNKLQNAIHTLSTVMESIVGRMVYRSDIVNQLNPMKDNAGLANVLEIIQHQIKDKQTAASKLEHSAERQINSAIKLRGVDVPFRRKQIVHFSDEVLQFQRRADMLAKLLADTKTHLNEANTTTVTVVS